eukprot:scaffold58308_cov32-Tisochrysis_lutea.AAC.2
MAQQLVGEAEAMESLLKKKRRAVKTLRAQGQLAQSTPLLIAVERFPELNDILKGGFRSDADATRLLETIERANAVARTQVRAQSPYHALSLPTYHYSASPAVLPTLIEISKYAWLQRGRRSLLEARPSILPGCAYGFATPVWPVLRIPSFQTTTHQCPYYHNIHRKSRQNTRSERWTHWRSCRPRIRVMR